MHLLNSIIYNEEVNEIQGIYKIINKINNNCYIGFSVNIEKRWSDHKTKAIHPQKQEDFDKVLYKAIRKYGVDSFLLEIIEELPNSDIDFLKEREIYWIDFYDSYRHGYNMTLGGDFVGNNNIHRGEEHGRAVFNNEDVIFCRNAYKNGERCNEVYYKLFKDKYTLSAFRQMWHGKRWNHIMPEVFENNPHPRCKFPIDVIKEIRTRFDNGEKMNKLVEDYSSYGKRTAIYNIAHRISYKNIE